MIIIGVAGYARAGKDSFCTISEKLLTEWKYRSHIYSFAAQLKNELAPFLADKCGVDAWTDDPEIKSDVRDLYVWYGTTWWRKRDPDRWIRGVEVAMKLHSGVDVGLVSDVRYPNEEEWIHSKNGILVHLKKYRMAPRIPTSSFDDGPMPNEPLVKHYDDAPNEQEKIYDPILQQKADILLEWEHQNIKRLNNIRKDPYLISIVEPALKSALKKLGKL